MMDEESFGPLVKTYPETLRPHPQDGWDGHMPVKALTADSVLIHPKGSNPPKMRNPIPKLPDPFLVYVR